MPNRFAVVVSSVSLFLLVLFGSTLLRGQATTSLHGTVYDPQKSVVSGATVTITNKDTGFSRTTQSDSQGVYQFLQVPPATYQVEVTAIGFTPVKQTSVVLQVSTPATLDFNLKVQTGTVEVEVTGSAPVVNTQDASQGNAFNSVQLTNLPAEARDPVAILSLQPGVTYIGIQKHDQQDNDSRGGAISGARSDQANIMLDGLDNNDQLRGYAFEGALRATLDSLQEFRVTTTNGNADSGRSSGAQVNLVTKSGTNSIHGSGYEYHRPTFTAANDWFNKQSQVKSGLPNIPGKVLRNTFGGTVGGPIKKNRAFFFGAYEGDRLRESQQTTRTIPSDALRLGTVQYQCDAREDASCGESPNPFPGVTVTQPAGFDPNVFLVSMDRGAFSLLDPNCTGNGTCPLGPGANQAVLDVFNTYPSPNSDAGGDGLNLRAFTFPAPNPNNLNTYIVKLDFKLTQNGNHSIFVRGNLQNDRESTPPELVGQAANNFRTNNSKGIAVGYTALLSSTLINNFRYAFVRQGTGDSGLTNSNLSNFRGVDDPRGFTRTILTNVPVHNFADDISWTKGKHTLQFGTNWRFVFNNRQSNAQNFSSSLTNVFWLDVAGIANQGLSLDPAAFGYPAVSGAFSTDYDFAAAAVAGLLTQVNTVYNQDKNGNIIPLGAMVPRHFRSFEGEFYAQDSWRATPHLMLTAGLRYSLLQPPYETGGNQAAPDISLHDFFNKRAEQMLQGNVYRPTITIDIAGQANGKKPYWNWDYKNFAPRFAFAYSPHSESGIWNKLFGSSGKSSIRGGYGIYFDHFGQGIVNSFDRQGSFGLTTTLVNPAGSQDVDCVARFESLTTVPTGTFCGQNVTPPPPGKFPVTPPGGSDAGSFAIYWGLDDKLKTPYSHVFDFSITREIASNFALEVGYTGRLGRRLLQEADLAMPLNLVDPASKTSYFQAATQLAVAAEKGVDINSLAPIPYWEHLFSGATGAPAPSLGLGFSSTCAPGNYPASPSATQAMYDLYSCFLHNETTALFVADLFCLPACANSGPFSYFDDQFSSLYSWRSQGNSSYHAAQVTLRHAMSRGLQFDFNYTYSKSMDVGSNAERVNQFESGPAATGGFGDQVINAWSPNQLRSISDFDTTHQFNSNWLYELPFGKGKMFGGGWGSAANAIAGGWSISGLARWTSGFPFTVNWGEGWATNWELQGSAFKIGNPGKVGGVYRDPQSGDPNMFQMATSDAVNLRAQFRSPHPGESGQRNNFRGPGYFGVDLGLGKTWAFKESQNVQFRWEVFNVSNSVRFDAASSAVNESLSDIGSFGKYQSALTKARLMQFALRYTF
jgi:carboxypeptidase family protein